MNEGSARQRTYRFGADLLGLLTTACLAVGCSQAPESASTAGSIAHQEASVTATKADEPRPAATAAPRTISVSTAGTFEADFDAAALQFMQTRALPASLDLKAAVADLVRENKAIGNCVPSASRNQAHLVDIDGDGEQEGLAIYTLESCGGPQYATRVLAVLRQTPEGKWAPVVETAIAVKAGARRPIIAIDTGEITLSGEDDGFGGMTEPDVIKIPAAGAAKAPAS